MTALPLKTVPDDIEVVSAWPVHIDLGYVVG